MRHMRFTELRAGALEALERWLDENGWYAYDVVRKGDEPGTYHVDEGHADFLLQEASFLGLAVVSDQ